MFPFRYPQACSQLPGSQLRFRGLPPFAHGCHAQRPAVALGALHPAAPAGGWKGGSSSHMCGGRIQGEDTFGLIQY